MTTKSLASHVDELQPEYDLASLSGRVQGKYYKRATAGVTLVLLDPDVAEAFPSGPSVNLALRAYLRSERLRRSKLASTKRSQPTAARRSAKARGGRRG